MCYRKAQCAFLLAIGICPPLARAATTEWNTNLGGSYTTAGNWSAGIPTSSDIAYFDRDLNIQYGITFPGRPIATPLTRETRQLIIGTNSPTFSDSVGLNQVPASFKVDSGNTLQQNAMIVGESTGQIAKLSTTLSDFSAGTATIGSAAGSTGTLNVGAGSFSVTRVTSDIIGQFLVGNSGTGTLNVSGGAHAAVSGRSQVGRLAGSSGTVTVTGAGSSWSSGNVELGVSGSAVLTVSSGGHVTGNSEFKTAGPNVAINVTGAGSILEASSIDLTKGSLTVQSGGAVIDDAGAIRNASFDIGGSGSTWTNNAFTYVGYGGQGFLNVHDGAHVTSISNAYIGYILTSSFPLVTGTGTATIDGTDSRLMVGGDFFVGGTGIGTLSITNGGGVSVAGTMYVGPSGIVKGNSTLTANVSNQGGIVAPGLSPGPLHITGNYSQASSSQAIIGELQIELGGTTPGVNYDQLLVSGNVEADGSLTVSLVNGFAPHAGDTFNILDFASLTGSFDQVTLPALIGPIVWNTSQLYTTGVLSVASTGVPGDYNTNGVVDAADYVVWRKANNSNITLPNDSTPGSVNSSDYTVWRSHFGQTTGSGTDSISNATIPEPETLFLFIIGVWSTCILRRTTVS
jgi:T5SS/PEP-CTERM-associated repeat protein